MGQRTKKDKDMPHHMVIFETLFGVYHSTCAIQRATCENKPEQDGVGVSEEKWHEYQYGPAHEHIY
jgi:hypothetical protein